MQPTNSEKPTDLVMWWPSPAAFSDLEVTDIEEGWQLSAPDGSELADWIQYWDQSEEHHKLFEDEFLRILIEHAELTLEQHGENENQPDRQDGDRVLPENDGTGTVA